MTVVLRNGKWNDQLDDQWHKHYRDSTHENDREAHDVKSSTRTHTDNYIITRDLVLVRGSCELIVTYQVECSSELYQ